MRVALVVAVLLVIASWFFFRSQVKFAAPGSGVEVTRAKTIETDFVLHVRVTDSRSPLVGARVTATLRAPGSSSTRPKWEAPLDRTTDAEGLAKLTVRSGNWFVLVQKDGFAEVARDVSIEGDARITVSLEQGFELRGLAVALARIEATPLGERLTQRVSVPVGAKTVNADASGSFHLQGLSRGWWRLEGEAEGFGRSDGLVIRVPSTESVRLVFRPFGFIEGFVVNADGSPAARATVSVVGETERITVDCSDSGAFALERPAGAYRLSARQGDFVGSLEMPAFVRSRATTSVKLTLAGKGGTLRGRVTRDDGAPVSRATVSINGEFAQLTTDDEGRWKLEHLAPGTYDVVANAPGMSETAEPGFHLDDGDDVEMKLVLARLGSVSGSALGATVVTLEGAYRQFPERQTVTDSSGRFAFTEIPAGDVLVRVSSAADDSGASVPAVVLAGKNTDVKLELPTRSELRVEIDRGDCKSAEPVRLRAAAPDGLGAVVEALVTSNAATLRLGEGMWSLRATVGTSCAAEAEVNVKSSSAKTLRLVAAPSLLTVTVLEANGDPSPRATVNVLTKVGTQLNETTDLDGRASIGVKREMIHVISARKDGRSARATSVSADTLTLTLSPAARLKVLLEGADSLSRLTVLSSDGVAIEARSSSHEVLMNAVPADELEVRVANADDTKFGSSTVVTRPGETVETTVKLVGIGSISGTAVLPPGAQSQARVIVSSKFGTMAKQLAAGGAFTFAPLPEGEFTVVVRCTGCTWAEQTVKVEAGRAARVEFR